MSEEYTQLKDLTFDQGFRNLKVYVLTIPEARKTKKGLMVQNIVIEDKSAQGTLALFGSQIDEFEFREGDTLLIDGFAKTPFTQDSKVDISIGREGSLKVIKDEE